MTYIISPQSNNVVRTRLCMAGAVIFHKPCHYAQHKSVQSETNPVRIRIKMRISQSDNESSYQVGLLGGTPV